MTANGSPPVRGFCSSSNSFAIQNVSTVHTAFKRNAERESESMARKRMLSPEVWDNPIVGQLGYRQRLLYIGLKSYSDDEGRFRAHPALIKSFVFPFDNNLSLAEVAEDLKVLSENYLIETWIIDGQDYGRLPNWHDEQKVQYPTASRIPSPPRLLADAALPETTGAVRSKQADAVQPLLIHGVFREDSMSPPGSLGEDSPVSQSSLGQEKLVQVEVKSGQVASDDDWTKNRLGRYWTLSADDLGGFQSKDVREAYARLTGNLVTKSDRDQIELTGADYPFSSRALVTVMEIISAKCGGMQVRSFAYFRAGITEVWKRCVDAEENASRMSVGTSVEKRRELILLAVRREIGQWSRRVA